MQASEKGQQAVARLPVDGGADVNVQIKDGWKEGWTALSQGS